jgi:bifunctional non-homologous end joining protein LigD
VRRDAPITREDALRTQCTFLRHGRGVQRFIPDVVPRLAIREEKKVGEYLFVDSANALVALVEHDVVEWHAWNATVDDVEHPDRVVFDLDPGGGTVWADVVAAARLLRKALRAVDLQSWVKTTGGKGLHVVVPFRRGPGWDAVFDFSRSVATAIARSDPARYTISFARDDRRSRVLIDYKRNHRTSIAVAAYSMRARPSAPMSVPVRWEELTRIAPDQFTAGNIRDRLRRLRSDPWATYWTTGQSLPVS